jgi:hypothetical protein
MRVLIPQEVSDVLIKQGVDLNNNRFLILQVQVTHILWIPHSVCMCMY